MADSQIAYGVWIRGKGWLKVNAKGTDCFADDKCEVAESAARLWGRGALVTPIDDSLIALEAVLIERDRRNRWSQIASIFK